MASIKVAVVENADEEHINLKLEELGLADRYRSSEELQHHLVSIQVITPPVILFAPDRFRRQEIDSMWDELKKAVKDCTRVFITYIG
jgi:hypothetical protein